jgi:hypothetical protein
MVGPLQVLLDFRQLKPGRLQLLLGIKLRLVKEVR